jgi:hypothetical protein
MFSAFNTMGSTLAIPKKNNTSLNVFTINGYSVSDGNTYYLPYDSNNSVTVVATSSNPNASVVVSGDTGLTIGNNTITVTVSINSYTSTYTVTLSVFDSISYTYTGSSTTSAVVMTNSLIYKYINMNSNGNLILNSAGNSSTLSAI